ncbi:sensor histidine kinase [Brevibacillus humidisoli]|uniref:ATP-binding protein n=1 Tax=Brevibacillus humidisoli TaxID=2895522 RepID=UPI001E3D7922|nr:sensor histidine kinase [Brevibacillus humidisoli]UFJ38902.1 sensor histidine kinase [Brevibacillus humidisoli]
MRLWPITMRTRIAVVISAIVVLAVVSGDLLVVGKVTRAYEQELGNRVMAIGQSLAQSPTIREGLQSSLRGWRIIQPIAERVRLVTKVDYIVVFDMNKVRYSHPLEARIGTVFQGGDEGPSLAEQSYVSRAVGVEGQSIRAFVPVMDDEGRKQLGVVVVGIMVPTFLKFMSEYRGDLYLSLFIGTSLGLVGAWLLANKIKRQMRNMEPEQIARLLEEREALIESIGEGIIAIDQKGRITVFNEQASQLLGITADALGRPIDEAMAGSNLPEVMRDRTSHQRQIQYVNDTIVLVNRVPIIVDKQIVGAVATIQDRTEIYKLAEELTGVKKLMDALRAQNHEYMNKLHTIAGLIQLRRYDEAVERIMTFTEEQQEQSRFLTKRIADYSISGLILGKMSRAREQGVQVTLHPDSQLLKLPETIAVHDLLVILGNLLENAIDAAAGSGTGGGQVSLRLEGNEDGIEIEVVDNGTGISPEIRERIFEHGFTTKGERGQGIGLSLVRQYVDFQHGTIEVDSEVGVGTRFFIYLPAPAFVPERGGEEIDLHRHY